MSSIHWLKLALSHLPRWKTCQRNKNIFLISDQFNLILTVYFGSTLAVNSPTQYNSDEIVYIKLKEGKEKKRPDFLNQIRTIF